MKEIIQRAVEGGFDKVKARQFLNIIAFDGVKTLASVLRFNYIIFSHDFLKAFFGEEDEWDTTPCDCGGIIHPMLDTHESGCKRSYAKRSWIFHAQQLVLSEDRIGYLKSFIKGSV